MRKRTGIPVGKDILQALSESTGEERKQKETIIKEMEHEAMVNMEFQNGFYEVMEFLEKKNIPKGILTRNNTLPVDFLIKKSGITFNAIITRDDFQPVKPAPDPLLHICKNFWGFNPSEVLMVGDHLDDLMCGRGAQCVTVLLKNPSNVTFQEHAHLTIESLNQIITLFEEGFYLDVE